MVYNEDAFFTHVNSLSSELVGYLVKHISEQVQKYNETRKPDQEPKCIHCEIDDMVESIVDLMREQVKDEMHELFESDLYKKHNWNTDKEGEE